MRIGSQHSNSTHTILRNSIYNFVLLTGNYDDALNLESEMKIRKCSHKNCILLKI